MIQPILVAVRGKGVYHLLRRLQTIARRYGSTPDKYHGTLGEFVKTLHAYRCQATFPITFVALQRHVRAMKEFQSQGIEFAVHGYRHIDHSTLSTAQQQRDLSKVMEILPRLGIEARGFRSPYLRWNEGTLEALREHGFAYDSSQAVNWPIDPSYLTPAYQGALQFYRSLPCQEYLSLPVYRQDLVQIPYSLPDDEALVERLNLLSEDQREKIWSGVLKQSHAKGELFTLGLHPERFSECAAALKNVLKEARQLTPPVWIARLDEIADWWRSRALAKVCIEARPEEIRFTCTGPKGIAFLVKNIKINQPSQPWYDGYQIVESHELIISPGLKPMIGVSPGTSPALIDFLSQQGYLVEQARERETYGLFIHRPEFNLQEQRSITEWIEREAKAVVKINRWPGTARSALAITGDIDALTYWDYGLRFLKR